jgi:hypothetical protein
MKLNSEMVERAVTQLGADPIPEQHPAMPQLSRVFGVHTFFIDPNGLHIVEPSQPNAAGDPTGEVFKVARWSDPDHTTLSPHQPEPTGITVVLAGTEPDSAA